MSFEIRTTAEFRKWLEHLQPKQEAQVRKRLILLETSGHLGDYKSLGEGLFELRWKNGIRVYFSRVGPKEVILLLGGIKNVQDKQIEKARRMLR